MRFWCGAYRCIDAIAARVMRARQLARYYFKRTACLTMSSRGGAHLLTSNCESSYICALDHHVVVATQPRRWPRGPRFARNLGASSFGAVGSPSGLFGWILMAPYILPFPHSIALAFCRWVRGERMGPFKVGQRTTFLNRLSTRAPYSVK